jgi:hypothetical protein
MFLKQIDHHQSHSDGNTGIRDVESRPMMIFVKKIQEIDHFPIKNTVDHITNRAAENQYQPKLHHFSVVRGVSEKSQYGNNRNRGNYHKEESFVLRGVSREHSEGHSRIADVGQMKKIIDHLDRVILGNMCSDHVLCELIENNHGIRDQKQI